MEKGKNTEFYSSFVSITIQTNSEDKNLLKKDLAQKLIQLNKYVLEKMEIQVDDKTVSLLRHLRHLTFRNFRSISAKKSALG